jgi:hypothetical protein
MRDQVKKSASRDRLNSLPNRSENDALNFYLAAWAAVEKEKKATVTRNRKPTTPNTKTLRVPLALVPKIQVMIEDFKKNHLEQGDNFENE